MPGGRYDHPGRTIRRRSPLPGYRKVKPMVFAGIYPVEGEDYANLKDALEKLQLNDASLIYEPETSQALNFGFRCGFLGMFHMEIIQERLEREYDLDIIVTAPSVEYEVVLHDWASVIVINSPADLPDEGQIAEIREPWMKLEIFTPTEFYGTVMDLATKRRGDLHRAGLPGAQPGAAQLRNPALRADRRFLRPAEIAHARLCLDGLPVRRIPPG